MNDIRVITVDVQLGETLSREFSIEGLSVVAVLTPSTFTGTSLKFDVSVDGTNFFRLHTESGAEYSLTIAPGKAQVMNPLTLMPFKHARAVVTAQNPKTTISFCSRVTM